jgi:hypothetical protein
LPENKTKPKNLTHCSNSWSHFNRHCYLSNCWVSLQEKSPGSGNYRGRMCGPLRGCIHQLRTQSVSTSCQWKKTRHTHQNTYKIGKCIKTLPTQVDIYVKIFTIQSLWCYQIGTVHIEGMRWTNIPSHQHLL